jgi:hypothetical protein
MNLRFLYRGASQPEKFQNKDVAKKGNNVKRFAPAKVAPVQCGND